MTTLPQNTPMRAPRTNGNGHQLAVPAPLLPQQAAAGANVLSGADVWRVIRANIWLILVTLMAAAIIGYLANMYLLAKYPHYTSLGLLIVRTPSDMPRSAFDPGGGTDPAGLEIEQRTQIESLTNETLLSEVLANPKSAIRDTEWFKQFITFRNGAQEVNAQAAKQNLLEHLDVSQVPNSRLIRVRMTYSVPKDCKTIVEEVCKEHIKNSKIRQTSDQQEKASALRALQNQYEEKISINQSNIDAQARELAKFGISPGNGGGIKQLELSSLMEAGKEAQLQVNRYTSLLETFKKSVAAQNSHEVITRLANDGRYQSLKSRVDDLETEVDAYAAKYGEKHDLTQNFKLRLDRARKTLLDVEAEIRDSVQAEYEGDYTTGLTTYSEGLKQINDKIALVTQQIAELSKKQNDYAVLVTEQTLLRQKLDHVLDEWDKVSTTMNSSKWTTVDWNTMPNLPDYPSFPRLPIVMAMSLFMGLALSIGIAFLREMTDTTVRSPRDIARVGQMTLLGMIPHADDDPQLSGARLPLAIYEAPHSVIAEQFRQVRTRMQHAASLDTTRSILVSGCSPGDGKTVVATNIAAGLALNGRRILLVDANFRRPNVHSVFAMGNEAGFGDVLNSPELFDECIRPTEVPNLSVMTSGARPSNPTELLESQLLVDFIERALQEYDHVIFDSGPLLMVSDSIALAPRVDGVITVVRARGNSRGLLQRVRDELRRLKAEHLGVVLNAVRVQGGGYYGPMIKNYYAYQNQ